MGAPGADANAVIAGAAYIFKRDGENWLEEAKSTASDGAASDFFGGKVLLMATSPLSVL